MSEKIPKDRAVLVETVEVRGKMYDVYFVKNGTRSMQFQMELPGGVLASGDCVEAVRAEATKMTGKAKVKMAIPFIAVRAGKLEGAVAKGRHASSQKILIRWDSGETEQINDYNFDATIRPLSDVERAELEELSSKLGELQKTFRDLINKYKVNVGKLVDAEYKKAEGPQIAIVPASEINSNLSLRASDYVGK